MPKPRKYEIDPEWVAVLRADPCAYCGAPARDLDHIIAVTRGGDDTAANLTASCGRCNKGKYDDSLLIFLWKRSVEEPRVRSPRPGVHWRKDIKRWSAYVDLVRRHSLGYYDSPEEAVAAIERWWRANPDAMSPRARRKLERDHAVRELWERGQTMTQIAQSLNESVKAIDGVLTRLRKDGQIAVAGRGGPGKKRRPRRGEKPSGRGYRFSDQSPSRPWLVQVQAAGETLRARFTSEADAREAVRIFREHHRSHGEP